jgi:hypothetical protein
MTAMRVALGFLVAALVTRGAGLKETRSVLRNFNEAVRKPESPAFAALFTLNADYRDATRVLRGRDAIVSLFTGRQVWSERTPPLLREESIKLVGPSAALVDAQLIQYGSTIVKSGVPVVLLLEKEAGTWKISSWRMLGPADPETAFSAPVGTRPVGS